MSEIDWNLAPEGADSLKQAFSNNGNLQWFKGLDVYIGDGKYADTVSSRWKTIATRPQTKTVADAYEWNNQSVYAKEQEDKQEGEKWTHIDAFGDPCRILIDEKDNLGYVVILRQSGHYATPAESSLKPIKPKLTKAEAWDYAVDSGLYASDIEEKYDII